MTLIHFGKNNEKEIYITLILTAMKPGIYGMFPQIDQNLLEGKDPDYNKKNQTI